MNLRGVAEWRRGHARTRKDYLTEREMLEEILAKVLKMPAAELLG